jgi:hypothetical protein
MLQKKPKISQNLSECLKFIGKQNFPKIEKILNPQFPDIEFKEQKEKIIEMNQKLTVKINT